MKKEAKKRHIELSEKTLAENLSSLVKYLYKDENYYSKIGIVKSIDEVEYTCEVEFLDGSPNFDDVKLQQFATSDGLFIKPSIDSAVIVSFSSRNNAYISMFSAVEEVVIQGGVNEGMVKIVEQTRKLNDLVAEVQGIVNDLNILKTAFSSWVPIPTDGGAALKAIAATWYGSTLPPMTSFNKTDYENIKVKH